MIRAEVEKGAVKLEIKGSPSDLTAEVVVLINKIYSVFNNKDPKIAEFYKENLINVVNNGVAFYNAEDLKKVKDPITEIIKLLDDIEKMIKNKED